MGAAYFNVSLGVKSFGDEPSPNLFLRGCVMEGPPDNPRKITKYHHTFGDLSVISWIVSVRSLKTDAQWYAMPYTSMFLQPSIVP